MSDSLVQSRDLQSSKAVAVYHNHLIDACFQMTITQKRLFDMAIATIDSMKPWDSKNSVAVSIKDYAFLTETNLDTALRACRRAVKTMSQIQVVNILYKEPKKKKSEEKEESKGTQEILPKDNMFLKNHNPSSSEEEEKKEEKIKYLSYRNFFQVVEYIEDKGERLVRIQFSDWLTPYMSDLRADFTRLQLIKTMRLTSYYASRIYGMVILNQFRTSTESEVSRTFNIPELRAGLHILDDKKYPRWCDFKKRCLDGPIADLIENTPFDWVCEPKGSGQYLKRITITAKARKQQVLDFDGTKEHIASTEAV